MDIELDIGHSEMFPYGISLAARLGAERILIEPDILVGACKHRPDILGVRKDSASKMLVIVECEASHGKIFDQGGPVWRYAQNSVLRSMAEFHFILRFQAKSRAKRVKEWFGAGATIYDFDSLKADRQIELLDLLK